MKSSFKSKINRLLKFLGFNVVKAKRPRAKKVRAATPDEVALANARCRSGDGRTHFVGDGCNPPHPEFETRCVKQPSSDNDVSGPTS